MGRGVDTYLKQGARHQFEDSLVYGMRGRYIVVPQIQGQSVSVDVALPIGVGGQGSEFRSKQKALALPAVIQRLFAHAVPRQSQNAFAFIPQAKGKHSDQACQGLLHAP